MMHKVSHPLAFLLAMAYLPAGQATTTTTALEPFNDPTTTEVTSGGTSGASDATTTSDVGGGATTAIMGSFVVNNIDYAALSNDTSLRAQFESQCKDTVASAAGTSASNVQVTLSSGSVNVGYSIVLPAGTASSSARDALTAAVGGADGSLAADLLTALSGIPGITEVTSGSLSISNLVCDDVEHDLTGKASSRTGSLCAAGALVMVTLAAARRP